MGQKLIESRFVTGPKDALASDDVYEVTENVIRSRAEGLSDELLAELLGALKIPFEPLIETIEDAKELAEAMVAALESRISSMLGGMPSSISKAVGGIDVVGALLGYASLDLAWDYEGELIYIDPSHSDTYEAAKDALKKSRRSNKQDANKISNAIDQGAETIIFTEFTKKLIEADITPPLDEILGQVSSDKVRRDVSENVFPTVFDPTGKGDLNPSEAPGTRPGERETNTGNPSENPLGQPDYAVGDDFTDDPNAPGVDDPWGSGERGSGGDGASGSPGASGGVNGGVTVNPNPNSPIDWDTPPDNPYWDYVAEGDAGKSDNGGVSVGGYDKRPPGVRDNLPPWLDIPKNEAPGYNWDAVEEIKKNVRPDVVVARYPAILTMILHYYAFPEGEFDMGGEYTRLVNLLYWLDKDWARTTTRDATLGKLLHFSSASTDALHLFTAYPETDFLEEALIAKSYRYNDIGSLLKVQYPRLVI